MESKSMTAKDCLKNARYTLGMSQREFALFLDVNHASINLYESGKSHPSFPTIRRIVEKLKTKGIILNYSDLRDDK